MTSVDNEAGRASGHADAPLSVLGRQLAQELGQHYATEALDAIFCSDLQRASTTAQIAFSGRNLPLIQNRVGAGVGWSGVGMLASPRAGKCLLIGMTASSYYARCSAP